MVTEQTLPTSPITPVAPYVLIKDLPKEEEVLASGIILPGSNKEDDLTRALVVSIPKHGIPVRNKKGSLLGTRACLVEVGDRVLYEKFRGTDISVKGKPFVLLDESAIVALDSSE